MPIDATENVTLPLFKLARRTPFDIAPERVQELANEIFGAGRWEMRPSEGVASFSAVPPEKAVYLSNAGLASLWCVAHAAFQVMDVASRAQRAPKAPGQTEIDIGREYASLRIADYVAYAEALFVGDRDWPANLSRPRIDAAFDSSEGRTNNVFFGALAWIILHEIAHVHHGDEKVLPAELLVRQEYRADDFATRWILDDAGRGLGREFRVLMIVVALTWLFLNERVLGPGSDHPPAILRFREAAEHFQMGERSAALENAAYVFKALLDPATPAPHETPKEDFAWVSGRLESLFRH
jgi:hypothetical protein